MEPEDGALQGLSTLKKETLEGSITPSVIEDPGRRWPSMNQDVGHPQTLICLSLGLEPTRFQNLFAFLVFLYSSWERLRQLHSTCSQQVHIGGWSLGIKIYQVVYVIIAEVLIALIVFVTARR